MALFGIKTRDGNLGHLLPSAVLPGLGSHSAGLNTVSSQPDFHSAPTAPAWLVSGVFLADLFVSCI